MPDPGIVASGATFLAASLPREVVVSTTHSIAFRCFARWVGGLTYERVLARRVVIEDQRCLDVVDSWPASSQNESGWDLFVDTADLVARVQTALAR